MFPIPISDGTIGLMGFELFLIDYCLPVFSLAEYHHHYHHH